MINSHGTGTYALIAAIGFAVSMLVTARMIPFMKQKQFGQYIREEGPDRQKTTKNLSESLRKLGIRTFRLKTGTPARIKTNSIDFSQGELEPGTSDDIFFSYETEHVRPLDQQISCHLIYTNSKTHEIIRANLNKSSTYSIRRLSSHINSAVNLL